MAKQNTKKKPVADKPAGELSNNALAEEIKKLNLSIESLKKKYFYRLAGSPGKIFLLALLKGLITGMAAIIGATALAALFVYVVGSMTALPEWLQGFLNNIINIVEGTR